MKYKYVIIFFDEDGTVWKVYKLKNKQILKERVSAAVETGPHMVVLDVHTFTHSDNDIVKRARKCERIIEL